MSDELAALLGESISGAYERARFLDDTENSGISDELAALLGKLIASYEI